MTERKGDKPEEEAQTRKLVMPIRRGDLYIRGIGIHYEISQMIPMLDDKTLSKLDELARDTFRQTIKEFLNFRSLNQNRE